MKTLVIAIFSLILKSFINLLRNKRKVKNVTNLDNEYPMSEAFNEAKLEANGWKMWQALLPELKVNPDIEPEDLWTVKKKYKISLIWAARLSNLRLIKKDENNEVILLPVSRYKALYSSCFFLLSAACCLSVCLYPILTIPNFSNAFIFGWLVFTVSSVTCILIMGFNFLSLNLNAVYYIKFARKNEKN